MESSSNFRVEAKTVRWTWTWTTDCVNGRKKPESECEVNTHFAEIDDEDNEEVKEDNKMTQITLMDNIKSTRSSQISRSPTEEDSKSGTSMSANEFGEEQKNRYIRQV